MANDKTSNTTSNTTSLSEGAGATTSRAGSGSSTSASYRGDDSTNNRRGTETYASGSYRNEDYYSDDRSRSREVVLSDRSDNKPETATIVGAALAGAVIGAALPFMLGRSGRSEGSRNRQETALVTESIVINKPARELYNFWRDFTNLSKFMDNIKSVEKLDDKRSHWVIKAPAGTSVEFDSRVVDEVPGRLIAWESEEGASVPNRGRVEFIETGSGGSTNVTTTISYDPPAGAAGRLVAKLFQREPAVQAREDLARLKRLMETGSAD